MKTFAAYTPSADLAVPVAKRVSGSCWTGSITVTDPHAYRCLARNQILDPCFAPPDTAQPDSVVCVPDPWSGAKLVQLTEPLPPRGLVGSPDRYWALELANGVRCLQVTGTVPVINGVEMPYICDTTMAAGQLRRDGNRLIARYGSLTGTTLEDVAVAVAWRA